MPTVILGFSDMFLPTKSGVFVLYRPVTGSQLPLPLNSKVLKEPTWHQDFALSLREGSSLTPGHSDPQLEMPLDYFANSVGK